MPEYTYPTPEPVDLYVENGSGHVDVTARETDRAEVRVVGRQADDVEVTYDGGRLSVVAPKHRGIFSNDARVDMDIVVPVMSEVMIKSGSAEVNVEGPVAEARVKSGSGDVRLDRLAGTGVVDTGSGEVSVGEALGELRVRSGSGDVLVGKVGAAASLSTGSGDVRIRHSQGPVVVKTGSGDLEVVDAESDVAMSTGSGDTTIRTMRQGRINGKSASGDIQVGIPDGLPVFTDITTVSGSVESSIRGVGEPEEGAPYVEIRATTVSGDVVIEPA